MTTDTTDDVSAVPPPAQRRVTEWTQHATLGNDWTLACKNASRSAKTVIPKVRFGLRYAPFGHR